MSFNWDHIVKPISTADAAASTPNFWQKFQVTQGYRNQLLKHAVVGLMFYNLPSFGRVILEVWSDEDGAPGRLLAQSDSFNAAECNTALFAYRIMGFTFPPLAIKRNTFYHLTVRPSAYTGDGSSHIAWRQAFPNPANTSGLTLTLEYGAKMPYDVVFASSDL